MAPVRFARRVRGDVQLQSESEARTENVLLIVGHPRAGSFCEALADAYAEALPDGHALRRINLADLDFNPDVLTISPRDQALGPDLEEAQESILWANHLVFVFPTWWGTMPARLKGFLDRVLTPEFAFRETARGYEPLLAGRTAHLITTMDTPAWVYRCIHHSPGIRALRLATLGFCGVRPAKVSLIGPVKPSSLTQREAWLRRAGAAARGLAAWRRRVRRRATILSWVKLMRLQFYAMTMLAYGLGAFAAVAARGETLRWWSGLTGFALLFLIELAAVLTNELHDLPSDELNEKYGPFNGGSRVLVNRELSPSNVRQVRNAAFGTALILTLGMAFLLPAESLLSGLALIAVGLVLGPGYTAPPLRLAWRGWGEVNVAVTHSIYMLLCGWVFQAGAVFAPFPWLVSVPLGLAIFVSILLAGIPDFDADSAAGKQTLVVMIGTRAAAALALLGVLASVFALIRLAPTAMTLPMPGWLSIAAFTIHLLLLVTLIGGFCMQEGACRRIDGLIALALGFVLWFCIYPLFHLDALR